MYKDEVEKITTTQVQRNPSLLTKFKNNNVRIVTKGGKEVSAIIPIEMYNGRIIPPRRKVTLGDLNLSQEFINKMREIKDPVKWQRELRKDD